MRRFGVLLSLVSVMLLGILAFSPQPNAVAQEATPGAAEAMEAGVTYEPVAFAFGQELASPADLSVVRIGLEPGAGFPLEASDPTAGLLVVESGTFTVEIDAPLSVSRGAALSAAVETEMAGGEFASPMEDIAAGEVVTLETGDAAFIPGGIAGELRNDGQEPAVGLAFLVGPEGIMMDEATPAP